MSDPTLTEADHEAIADKVAARLLASTAESPAGKNIFHDDEWVYKLRRVVDFMDLQFTDEKIKEHEQDHEFVRFWRRVSEKTTFRFASTAVMMLLIFLSGSFLFILAKYYRLL